MLSYLLVVSMFLWFKFYYFIIFVPLSENIALCDVWYDVYSFILRILEAYRTGRGRVVVRGKTEFELLDSKTKRTAIIIKEVAL